jgi:hypothetical protein
VEHRVLRCRGKPAATTYLTTSSQYMLLSHARCLGGNTAAPIAEVLSYVCRRPKPFTKSAARPQFWRASKPPFVVPGTCVGH